MTVTARCGSEPTPADGGLRREIYEKNTTTSAETKRYTW